MNDLRCQYQFHGMGTVPATLILCGPGGKRPACDDCARTVLSSYQGWIEPLESWQDPLEAAKAQLAASIAPPPTAPVILTSGQQKLSSASPRHPHLLMGLGVCGTGFLVGLVLIATGMPVGGDIPTPRGPGFIPGIIAALGCLIIAACLIAHAVASDLAHRRRQMLAGMTPEQRSAYLRAEKIAAWTAAAGMAVALHEHNKHEQQRLSASVYDDQYTDRVGQAMAASAARRREQVAASLAAPPRF
jgi:hypothetical protein